MGSLISTFVGMLIPVVLLPIPSWPCSPFPHIITSPSTVKNVEKILPHEIFWISGRPFIDQTPSDITELVRSELGSPSYPSSPHPKQWTLPLVSKVIV